MKAWKSIFPDRFQVQVCPPLAAAVSALTYTLRDAGITDVVVTGLAGDYCVQSSARHSAEDGFKTYVLKDAVRSVSEAGWVSAQKEMEKEGILVVDSQWVLEVCFRFIISHRDTQLNSTALVLGQVT